MQSKGKTSSYLEYLLDLFCIVKSVSDPWDPDFSGSLGSGSGTICTDPDPDPSVIKQKTNINHESNDLFFKEIDYTFLVIFPETHVGCISACKVWYYLPYGTWIPYVASTKAPFCEAFRDFNECHEWRLQKTFCDKILQLGFLNAYTRIIFPPLSLSKDGSGYGTLYLYTVYRRRQACILSNTLVSGHPTFRGPLSTGLPLSRGGGGAFSQGVRIFVFFSSVFRAGIFKQSMRDRNRAGIGLSYRPVRLKNRLAELIPWNRFLGTWSLKVRALLSQSQYGTEYWRSDNLKASSNTEHKNVWKICQHSFFSVISLSEIKEVYKT
jgi:hypothetical protein